MNSIGQLTRHDESALDYLSAINEKMVKRTTDWALVNTGSWNIEGLRSFSSTVADAFSELDAAVRLDPSVPFERVNASGEVELIETAPVVRVDARPDAPVQIVLTGHYDTVFPPGTFEGVKDIGGGRLNGPGLADMKGGLIVMLEALKAFEMGYLKENLGYRIVISPDEEIGNFASNDAIFDAAQSGAMVGLTYEPCMETGELAGGRKGAAVFDISLRGKAAHAGRAKLEGRSAINDAAKIVVALEELNERMDGATVNVGAIEGGSAVNIVPDLAVIRFGSRAPDRETAEWVTRQVERITENVTKDSGVTAKIHGGFYRPPKPRNEAQSALFDVIRDTGKILDLDIRFADTGGVCEGNNVFAAGVPNVDTLGVRGGRIHSSEEFVEVDSFSERASLSALILNRLADGRIDGKKIKALMK